MMKSLENNRGLSEDQLLSLRMAMGCSGSAQAHLASNSISKQKLRGIHVVLLLPTNKFGCAPLNLL